MTTTSLRAMHEQQPILLDAHHCHNSHQSEGRADGSADINV